MKELKVAILAVSMCLFVFSKSHAQGTIVFDNQQKRIYIDYNLGAKNVIKNVPGTQKFMVELDTVKQAEPLKLYKQLKQAFPQNSISFPSSKPELPVILLNKARVQKFILISKS